LAGPNPSESSSLLFRLPIPILMMEVVGLRKGRHETVEERRKRQKSESWVVGWASYFSPLPPPFLSLRGQGSRPSCRRSCATLPRGPRWQQVVDAVLEASPFIPLLPSSNVPTANFLLSVVKRSSLRGESRRGSRTGQKHVAPKGKLYIFLPLSSPPVRGETGMSNRLIAHLANVEVLTPKKGRITSIIQDVIGPGGSVLAVIFSISSFFEWSYQSLKLTEAEQPGLGHIGWRAWSLRTSTSAFFLFFPPFSFRGLDRRLSRARKGFRYRAPVAPARESSFILPLLSPPAESALELSDRPQRLAPVGVDKGKSDNVDIMTRKRCGTPAGMRRIWAEVHGV